MSGKHAADLPVHVRRCTDNMAYLWYFDQPSQIGFEWTGDPADPIEVSHGGFGEPITNIIDASIYESLKLGALRTLVGNFEFICRSWAQAITADIWGREPQRVINSGDVRHG